MGVVVSSLVGKVSIDGVDKAKVDLLGVDTANKKAQSSLDQLQAAAKNAGNVLSNRFTAEIKKAQNSLQDVAKRAEAAGMDVSKLATLQVRASESASRLSVAQAQAAASLKKAHDAASDGKTSAEQLALLQTRAANAADKVHTAENAAGNAMAKVHAEANRLSSAMSESASKSSVFGRAMESIKSHLSGTATQLKSTSGGFLDFASKASMAGMGLVGLVKGAIGLGQSLLEPVMSAESLGVSFTTLMGSAKAATAEIKELNRFADITPFEPGPVQEYAAQLIGMGIDANQTIPIMTALGDALFGIGHGTEAEMKSVVDQIGKIRVAGVMTWGDISQLQTHGIDVLGAMTLATGKTKESLREMAGHGGIPAKEAIDALTKGIEMNPLYQGGMAKQASTLSGVLSTLTGYFKTALNSVLGLKDGMVVTGGLIDRVKGGIAALGTVVSGKSFQEFATVMGERIGMALSATINFVTTQLIPAFQTFGSFLSEHIIPPLQAAGKWFSDFVGRGQVGIPILAGLAAVVGGLLVGAFLALDIAISPVAIAVVGIGLAVAGLTAVFMHFYNSNAGFRGWLLDAGTTIKNVAMMVRDTFIPVWEQLQQTWKSQIQPSLQSLMDSFERLRPVLNTIGQIIGGYLAVQVGIFVAETGALVGAIVGVARGITEFIGGTIQIIAGDIQIISGIIAFIVDLFTGRFDRLKGDIKIILDGIGQVFSGWGNMLKGINTGIVEGVKGGFKGMFESGKFYFALMTKETDDATAEAKNKADLHTLEMQIAAIKNAEGMDLGVIQKLDHMRMGVADQLRQTKDDTERQTLTIKLKHIEAAETQRVAVWESHKKMRKDTEGEHDKLKKHIEDNSGGIIGSIQRFFGGIGQWFADRWKDVQNAWGGLGQWFQDRFSEAKNGVTGAFGAIGQWFQDRWVDVQNIWGGVGQWFNDRGRDIWNGITGFFGAIGQWFSDRWSDVMNSTAPFRNYMSAVFETIWNILVALWGRLGQWFNDRFTEARNKIVEIFGPIGQWFNDRWREVQNIFGAVGQWFHDRFAEAWGGVTSFFGFLGQWFGDRWRDTQNVFIGVGGWFRDRFAEAWGGVTSFFGFLGRWFGDRWNETKAVFAPVGNYFRERFQEAWSFVTAVFAPIGNWFRDRWNETLVHVTNFKNSVVTKFNELKDGASNAFKGLVNGIVDQLNNGINAVERFINFLGQGLNSIATSLGTKGTIPIAHLGRIPRYAQGTEAHLGGPMIVGEEGPELVMAPRGTKVATHKETIQILAMMGGKVPGYAGGIGDIAGNIMNWIGGGAKSVLDNVIRAMNISAPNMPGMGNIAGALFDKVKGWAVGFIDKILPQFNFAGGGAVPGNVQSWIAQAMAATRVPASWAGALATIAMRESGGNPRAINLTDSNAKAGHPSQGLFQTIPSTFAAHALPGMGDILNPVHNAAAAIGYIRGRYGDVFHVPGILALSQGKSYIGYSQGGSILEPIAGIGLNTGNRYAFGEKGPETVIPGPYIPSGVNLSSSTPTGPINVHVHIEGGDTIIDGYRLAGRLMPHIVSKIRSATGATI